MISSLKVENFKGIRHLDIPQFHGVNLLLGVNDTGKSGLMKLIYAFFYQSADYFHLERTEITNNSKEIEISINEITINEDELFISLADKLVTTIYGNYNRIKHLISIGEDIASFEFSYGNDFLTKATIYSNKGIKSDRNRIGKAKIGEYTIGETPAVFLEKPSWDIFGSIGIKSETFIFIPPKEITLNFRDILAMVEKEKRRTFDDTYYDLAKAIARGYGVDRTHEDLVGIVEDTYKETAFNGELIFDDERNDFVYILNGEKLPAQLAAEGIRKIGLIAFLIRNREVVPGTILFVDEPENSLHPKATRAFMRMLVRLGQAGVQVFMASHDYTVLKQLEMEARRQDYAIGCYSLLRDQEGEIALDWSDLRERMPENEIVNVGAEMFEEEIKIDLGRA